MRLSNLIFFFYQVGGVAPTIRRRVGFNDETLSVAGMADETFTVPTNDDEVVTSAGATDDTLIN